MIPHQSHENSKVFFVFFLLILILMGVFFRFYEITRHQFFYYDEGLYLAHNLDFLNYVDQNPADSLRTLGRYLSVSAHMALADTKSLWFFLCDLRAYFLKVDDWYFTRVLSAVFGTLTLGMTYFFARRYFSSRWTAGLSAALLAVFPSHVYYSRLGMQEAMSTLCFVAGLYFYFFPRRLSWRIFFSGFLFACVFFTNYRMIIIPLLTGLSELFDSFSNKEKFQLRKYVWNTLTFLSFVFLVGNIDHGAQTKIAFAWMFYQSHLAYVPFDWFNLLSYPYYVFRLEGVLFGIFFFSQLYFLFRKKWYRLMPFAVTIFIMLIFSFPQEKGTRYLCVVMPFMVMSVAHLIACVRVKLGQGALKWFWKGAVIILFVALVSRSLEIIQFTSDYEKAVKDLSVSVEQVKIISSQPLIQKLFVTDRSRVTSIPPNEQLLLVMYARGYRYLMVDPQTYVSFTQDGFRFSPPLKGFLEFIVRVVKPYKVYPHFNPRLLERFVLEHNENLRRSLAFLKSNQDIRFGQLRVYDIKECFLTLQRMKTFQQNK